VSARESERERESGCQCGRVRISERFGEKLSYESEVHPQERKGKRGKGRKGKERREKEGEQEEDGCVSYPAQQHGDQDAQGEGNPAGEDGG
jgi:hypothetical protein